MKTPESENKNAVKPQGGNPQAGQKNQPLPVAGNEAEAPGADEEESLPSSMKAGQEKNPGKNPSENDRSENDSSEDDAQEDDVQDDDDAAEEEDASPVPGEKKPGAVPGSL